VVQQNRCSTTELNWHPNPDTPGKLSYLGNVLDVKDRERGVFDKEFSDVPLGKLKSALDRTRNKF